MKRLAATALLLLVSLLCPAQQKDTLRVLALGNSASEDAVEQYLHELALEDSTVLIIGNLYLTNGSLAKHFLNVRNDLAEYSYRKISAEGVRTVVKKYSISQALLDESWDCVSLQQVSHFSGFLDTYEPYMRHLATFFRDELQEGTRLMWHQTWAYDKDCTHSAFPNYNSDTGMMYRMIVEASRKVVYNYMLDIIPCGAAVQAMRDIYNLGPMTRNGHELSTGLGRYVAACTWYEALTHKSVLFNPYYPEEIDIFQAFVAQRAAHDAVIKPFSTK